MPRPTKHRNLSFLLGAARVLEVLEQNGELTVQKVADAVEVTPRTAYDYLQFLNRRGKGRKVFICRYIRNPSGRPTPLWKKGTHRNALPPRPYHRKRPVLVESVEG